MFLRVKQTTATTKRVWLPMPGTFNVPTDVNACDRIRGLYNTVRESELTVDSEENPLSSDPMLSQGASQSTRKTM